MSQLLNAAEAAEMIEGNGKDGISLGGTDNGDMEINEEMENELLGEADKGVEKMQAEVLAEHLWESDCAGKDHESCKRLLAADIDALLDKTHDLGAMALQNPVKTLFAVFLLKEGTCKSFSAARTITKTIIGAETKFEFIVYTGAKKDLVEATKFPSNGDLQTTLGLWVEHCMVAREKLKQTGFLPIGMGKPHGLMALAEMEQEKWAEVFRDSNWIWERVRASNIHKANNFVTCPRVLIGDLSAAQLKTAMERTELIGQEGSIAGVIRALNGCVLSSRVKGVFVMIGRDALLAGETIDTIMEQFQRLLHLLPNYGHVNIFWAPPPYVHANAAEHSELVIRLGRLLHGSHVQFVSVTETGRSLLELYRYGDTFNPKTVNVKGAMTERGIRAVCAWLYTQVPNFPGDRAIGIRTVRSQVVMPEGSSISSRHREYNNSIYSRVGGLGDPTRRHSSSSSSREHDSRYSNSRHTRGQGYWPPRRHSSFRPTHH